MQRREFSLSSTLYGQFATYFESFAQELSRDFLQLFVAPYPEMPAGSARWQAGDPATIAAVADLSDRFVQGLAAVESEALAAMDEDLPDAFTAGYEQALWELQQLGLEDALDAEDAGDPEEILAILTGASIGGVPYGARLAAWTGLGQSKFQQALRTSVAGGYSLDDTLALYGASVGAVSQGAAGLGGNELFYAAALGSAAAFALFGAIEVWLTREDERVCPICAALNRTITRKLPVRDSHPGCRCDKVPWLAAAMTPSPPLSWGAFQARRG